MKIYAWIAVIYLSCLSSLASATAPIFLTSGEVEKSLSGMEFNPEQFRPQMVSDLLKRHLYVGDKVEKVLQDFGPATGHFQGGADPSYLLQAIHNDVYQLIFLTDPDGKKVQTVKVHKKLCADQPPPPPVPPSVRVIAQGPKLGVEISGDVAKAIWHQIQDEDVKDGIKKGDGARCKKTAGKSENFVCEFTVDADGVFEAKK